MIKFIYFDLGGVIIKDFSGTNKWEQFKKDFNITDEYWETHEPDINRGHFQIDPSLVLAFVDRFEKNESIWPALEIVKEKLKIGLLTNMYPGMFQAIKDRGLLPLISWDEIIDSSLEGFCKPETEIFQIAQERSGANKSEILFVENSQGNVRAAADFGWQTFLYDSKDYEQSSRNLLEYIQHEFTE